MTEKKSKEKKLLDFSKVKPFVEEELVRTEWKGEKKSVQDLIGEAIAIHDFAIYPSRRFGGTFASIQATDGNNEPFWFNTGSDVLQDQLENIKDNLPQKVVIAKVKRYYTFQSPEE
jgi:hypothetical protein